MDKIHEFLSRLGLVEGTAEVTGGCDGVLLLYTPHLHAHVFGFQPHAGLAYGFDRMIMLMVGGDSIRDVIAFPKVKDASCLMTEAPSPVEEKQLEELGIQVKEEE